MGILEEIKKWIRQENKRAELKDKDLETITKALRIVENILSEKLDKKEKKKWQSSGKDQKPDC